MAHPPASEAPEQRALRERLEAAERRLGESEARAARSEGAARRYRALLDSVRWIAVELDRGSRVTFANPAFLQVTGYTEAEAVGKDWIATFLPERLRDEAVQRHRGLMASPLPVHHEGEILTWTGESRRIVWDSIVVLDDGDRASGSLSLGEDVTDRTRGEEALRNSEARYRAIIELAVDAVITIDHVGTIDSFNRAAARIFGYEPGEVIGRNVRLLMPSPYREEHDRYLSSYLETGKARIIGLGREVVGRRKDGSLFPIDLAVSEVQLGDRRTFTGIVRDISAKRRAEVLASTGTLASGMAHEIGTPLNVILGRAERLQERLREDAAALRELGIIVSQAERVTRLIQQLLAISRPHGMVRRTVTLNPLVRSVLEMLEERLARHRIELAADLAPGIPALLMDPDAMSQVLLNLVVNAIDAMPTGGSLRVATSVHPAPGEPGLDFVEIAVGDSGTGIAPEHVARIFDPFFTTKSAGRGTGLGLSVVNGILRDHGGDVSVETEIGRGTTFRVRLPVPAGDPSAAAG